MHLIYYLFNLLVLRNNCDQFVRYLRGIFLEKERDPPLILRRTALFCYSFGRLGLLTRITELLHNVCSVLTWLDGASSFFAEFFFEILPSSTLIWFHTIINELTNWFLGKKICLICVQKISYLKMGQNFENTTFCFVNFSAVGFLRPKSNFQHINCVICHI